jgi:hypothetical protein
MKCSATRRGESLTMREDDEMFGVRDLHEQAKPGSLHPVVRPPSEPKVSTMGMWMDNAFEPGKFIIVDCGYVKHTRARANADRLLKAMGINKGSRGYVEIGGFGRLLVRVPHEKKKTLKRFKRIRAGAGYCWTTHTYDKNGPQFKLKYAA